MNKKGLSPVVAAIILIAVTVAVSIVVAAWTRTITTETEESNPKIEVYQIGETITRIGGSDYQIEFAGIIQVDGESYLVYGRRTYNRGGYTGYIKIYENCIIQFYKNQQIKVLEWGNSWITLEEL